ncbi:hypothetical protein HDG33_006519 [Paraburkholderia sp. Cpub6]|nr:hypothetical protein [Paraburkholderia sp. Cpub6]
MTDLFDATGYRAGEMPLAGDSLRSKIDTYTNVSPADHMD